MVFVAVSHVKMWRCAPLNETAVVSSVVLWAGLPFFFYFGQNLTKKTTSCSHFKNKKCPDQFYFISKVLLLYCTLRTSCIYYENQMLKCDTFCWGNQHDPEQRMQTHSFQKHCAPGHGRRKTHFLKALGLAKYIFLYNGAFVASSKLICAATPLAQPERMSLAKSRQWVWFSPNKYVIFTVILASVQKFMVKGLCPSRNTSVGH